MKGSTHLYNLIRKKKFLLLTLWPFGIIVNPSYEETGRVQVIDLILNREADTC